MMGVLCSTADASRLSEKTVNLLPDGQIGNANYQPRHLAGYFSVRYHSNQCHFLTGISYETF